MCSGAWNVPLLLLAETHNSDEPRSYTWGSQGQAYKEVNSWCHILWISVVMHWR